MPRNSGAVPSHKEEIVLWILQVQSDVTGQPLDSFGIPTPRYGRGNTPPPKRP